MKAVVSQDVSSLVIIFSFMSPEINWDSTFCGGQRSKSLHRSNKRFSLAFLRWRTVHWCMFGWARWTFSHLTAYDVMKGKKLYRLSYTQRFIWRSLQLLMLTGRWVGCWSVAINCGLNFAMQVSYTQIPCGGGASSIGVFSLATQFLTDSFLARNWRRLPFSF